MDLEDVADAYDGVVRRVAQVTALADAVRPLLSTPLFSAAFGDTSSLSVQGLIDTFSAVGATAASFASAWFHPSSPHYVYYQVAAFAESAAASFASPDAQARFGVANASTYARMRKWLSVWPAAIRHMHVPYGSRDRMQVRRPAAEHLQGGVRRRQPAVAASA